jgi:hypothetical protein
LRRDEQGRGVVSEAAMPTQQEREQFLSDVRHAAGLSAAATVRWDENLETLAQVAAMGRYSHDDAPVWARDSELTAAHLSRRRSTMDEWDYRNIISALGCLLAEDRDRRVDASRGRRLEVLAEATESVECDDGSSDAGSDQSSSRASDVSDLSEVFETLGQAGGATETCTSVRSAFSLSELQKLAAAGELQHLVVNAKLAQAISEMSRGEALAFLGLDGVE